MTILYIVLQSMAVISLVCGALMFWKPKELPIQKETAKLPLLSIIIPARNEQRRIVPLLQSLQQQQWQHFEIIVADDGSTDDTTAVAQTFGARAVSVEQVGDIVLGKANACAYGAQHARGDWLLFLDADVQLADATSLQRIVTSFWHQQSKGILSVQPYHCIEKPYEQFSVVFNIIVLTGMNVFTFWREKFQTAGSFGPCILCDKHSYAATGGHAAAEESIMDDFALSDVFKAKRLPITNYAGKGVLNMRMYEEGFRQLIEGWTKNLATASQSTHPFVMALIQSWIFGVIMTSIVPFIAFYIKQPLLIIVSVVFYVLYGIHVFVLTRRAGNFSPTIIVLYPLFVLFFTVIFLYSLYRTHVKRSVMWRGRKINV